MTWPASTWRARSSPTSVAARRTRRRSPTSTPHWSRPSCGAAESAGAPTAVAQMTYAPERRAVRRCPHCWARHGILPALGHTDCDADDGVVVAPVGPRVRAARRATAGHARVQRHASAAPPGARPAGRLPGAGRSRRGGARGHRRRRAPRGRDRADAVRPRRAAGDLPGHRRDGCQRHAGRPLHPGRPGRAGGRPDGAAGRRAARSPAASPPCSTSCGGAWPRPASRCATPSPRPRSHPRRPSA